MTSSNNRNSSRRSAGSQNSGRRNESTRKKGSTIDTEDLKFSIGKDQAKNHEQLTKQLVNAVQGKHGASLAHTLLNEKDYQFPTITMGQLTPPQ